jgi:membrane protein
MRIPFLPPNAMAAFWRFYRRTEQAELDLIAAGVAFYAFLAIFPAAAAVIALWGFVSDPAMIRQEMQLLRPVVPPDVFTLLSNQVEQLLAVSSSNFGLTTLLPTALALWSARAGAAALIRGLNAIHQRPNRAGHRHQLRAMFLTFVLIGLVLAAMVMALVVPLLATFLPEGPLWTRMASTTNLGLAVVLGVLAVGLAFRLGPNHGPSAPPLLSWGLLVAVVLWVLVTKGFMLYLSNFPSYNRVYGSIGAVAALMMWLYLSAYAVLIGAAVDAERQRARRHSP